MVNFKLMSPLDPKKRLEAMPLIKRCANGALFKFHRFDEGTASIVGEYLGPAADWCENIWTERGKVHNRMFAEYDLDWSSARE